MSEITRGDSDLQRQRRRSAVLVLLGVLTIGSLPIVLPLSCVMVGGARAKATRQRLIDHIDHAAIRDAGRNVLQEDGYKVGRWIHPWELPAPLRDLEPVGAHIDAEGLLRLEFGGWSHHQGLIVAAEGRTISEQDVPEVQVIQLLTDGLCFYHDQ